MTGVIKRIKQILSNNSVVSRYVMDGFLVGSAANIAAYTHNLFAIRLGANDYQLGLVFFIPQMFNLIILIPGGLFIDSLHNKKRIVLAALAMISMGYILCSLSPFTKNISSGHSIYFFLIALALAGGAAALHNIAWQSYFPEIVDANSHNRVLTLRTFIFTFTSIAAPFLIGLLLIFIVSDSIKIIVYQLIFISSAFLFLLAANNFRKFQTVLTAMPKHISFLEFKNAVYKLFHNKKFLLFAGAALFFHLTWHIDWTLYFIGQVKYLNMNELQVGLVSVMQTAAQLLTLRFWSKKNERYGVELPLTFGILGLSLYPVSMIAAVSMPSSIGPHLFLLFHLISSMSITVISLNLFQCLLQVAGTEFRSFSLSVFACITCLSNAVMPVTGVALYRLLGGNLNGLRYTFVIVFVLRLIAAGLWLMRWRYMRKHQSIITQTI